ncbi:MAG: hypothetical protein V2A62_00010 [Candidatus Woesearchaeota archaeon]
MDEPTTTKISLERVLFKLGEERDIVDNLVERKIRSPLQFFLKNKPEAADPEANAKIPHLYVRDFEFVHPYWTLSRQNSISPVAGIGGFGIRIAFGLSLKKGEAMNREAATAWTEEFIRNHKDLSNIIGINYLIVNLNYQPTPERQMEDKRERSAIRTVGTVYLLKGLYVRGGIISYHEGGKEGIKEARIIFEKVIP